MTVSDVCNSGSPDGVLSTGGAKIPGHVLVGWLRDWGTWWTRWLAMCTLNWHGSIGRRHCVWRVVTGVREHLLRPRELICFSRHLPKLLVLNRPRCCDFRCICGKSGLPPVLPTHQCIVESGMKRSRPATCIENRNATPQPFLLHAWWAICPILEHPHSVTLRRRAFPNETPQVNL